MRIRVTEVIERDTGRRCSMIEGLLSTPADPLTIVARLRP